MYPPNANSSQFPFAVLKAQSNRHRIASRAFAVVLLSACVVPNLWAQETELREAINGVINNAVSDAANQAITNTVGQVIDSTIRQAIPNVDGAAIANSVVVTPSTVQPVVQPNTPVDLSSLPPDVLQCNVCRMRLGLQPIADGGTLDAAEHDRQAALQSAATQGSSTASNTNSGITTNSKNGLPNATNSNPVVVQSAPIQAVNQTVQPQNNVESTKKLSQFSSPKEASTVAAASALQPSINTVPSDLRFSSQSALQIELELAKRQLAERNQLIEQFSSNQLRLESQLSEVSALNRQYEVSLQQQNTAAEKLNQQLRTQANEATSKLFNAQQESEKLKRDLSVALANQKIAEQNLESHAKLQTAQLQKQIEVAQQESQKYREESELLRRQRDGYKSELVNLRQDLLDSANSVDGNSSAELSAAKARILELEAMYSKLLEKHKNMESVARANGAKKKDEVANMREQIAALQAQLNSQSPNFGTPSESGPPSQQTNVEVLIEENKQLMQANQNLLAEKAALASELATLKSQLVPSIGDVEPELTFTPDPALAEPSAVASDTTQDSAPQASASAEQIPSMMQIEEPKTDAPAVVKERTPFKVGPKTPPRNPRDAKPKSAERREI